MVVERVEYGWYFELGLSSEGWSWYFDGWDFVIVGKFELSLVGGW